MIDSRKFDHIRISLKEAVEAKMGNGFEDLTLVHSSLPNVDMESIDLATDFLGKKISMPIMIAGMTGGHRRLADINKNLALAAQELDIPLGVGSQRAALVDERLADTYSISRKAAPDAFLIANLGAVQFAGKYGIKEAEKAVEMISADALAIHLNPLQEAIQPEGDVNFKGCIERLEPLKDIGVPLIAKETGAGISREIAVVLEKIGFSAIDVAGAGGTSFAAVEHYRRQDGLGKLFWDWGISSAISTIECLEYTKLPVITSGGMRNGLEVAKALALGSMACGMALPFLKKAIKSHKDVISAVTELRDELRTAMFLVGAENIRNIKEKDIIIRGPTKEWLEARGIDHKKYANRSINL
jgi:isopentenyl-diphosphate delta-isomerase